MAQAQRRVYAPPEADGMVEFPRERIRRAPPQRDEPRGSGTRYPTFTIALIIVATVAYLLWTFSGGGAPQGDDAPVIKAESAAFKTRYEGAATEEPATAEIDKALVGQAPTPRAPAKARTVAETPVVAASPPAAPGAPPRIAAEGPYLAQIASLKSADAADAAWTRFSRRAPALFAPARKDVQQADLGERGIYFRVRAGYFATRADAAQFCGQVKSLGQECLVVGK
jgi:cell division septation protein DedD